VFDVKQNGGISLLEMSLVILVGYHIIMKLLLCLQTLLISNPFQSPNPMHFPLA